MDSQKLTKKPLSKANTKDSKEARPTKSSLAKKNSKKTKPTKEKKSKEVQAATKTKANGPRNKPIKRPVKGAPSKRPKETASSLTKRKNLVNSQASQIDNLNSSQEKGTQPLFPQEMAPKEINQTKALAVVPFTVLPMVPSLPNDSKKESLKAITDETDTSSNELNSDPTQEKSSSKESHEDDQKSTDSKGSDFSTLFFQNDPLDENPQESNDQDHFLFLEEANDLDFQKNDSNAFFLESDNKKKEEKDDKEVVPHSRPHYEDRILELIRTINAPLLLGEQLDDYHANDIADAIHELSPQEREKLYRMLDTERLTEILEYMDEEDQAKYLNEMNIRKVIAIFNRMEPDKAADILKEMSKEKSDIILQLLQPEVHRKISVIFSYDEDEIGSKMTPNYIEVPKGITVKEATERLIDQAVDNDNISTVYVQDENGMYYGAVTLKDLIVSKAATPLEEIVATSYPYVYAHEAIDRVVEELKDYNEDSIPVLNDNNAMVGVITSQDLLEVMDEEMGEDYAKLAGLAGEEDLEESLGQSLHKRLPWLIILLFLGLLVSMVVSLFEGVVAQLTLVMAFQSLILGMSGNVGTQSLAVTIRVLMDESLDRKQKFALIGKEIRVGFANGLLIGFVAFCLLGLYIHWAKGYLWSSSYAISLCIGVALWLSMIISSLTGTVFPIFFKKIGVDPAVASGPLITTINDMVGVVTYYGLAWLFLIQILHLH